MLEVTVWNVIMESITLNSIKVQSNLLLFDFTPSAGLQKYFKTDSMFVEYEDDMTSVPLSILTIPFVNIMAGFMWMSDCVLFVDEIDETYYHSLKDIKSAFRELHQYVDLKGVLVPSKIIRNVIPSSDNAILLFGGGVDCHSSFLRHKDKIPFILNIYGWLDSVEEPNAVDKSDKQQTEEYAVSMGVQALHVRSNFAALFDLNALDKSFTHPLIHSSYWYAFLHPMAFLSVATPLGWTHGISTIMIASSFTKGRLGVKCASYITTDSEYRFATNGATVHDAFELNRQDKVALIADYQKISAKPYKIQACSFNDHNCCECEKCFRTIVELVAENADPRNFGFDIKGSLRDHWKQVVDRDVALWGPHKEFYYYNVAAKKMRDNYDQINDKEFVDWFLSCDFFAMKKKALRSYYITNIWNILKRKLHIN